MSGLLFIRHAETNMAGTFCGWSNPHVNARGEEQIRMLVKELETEPINAIYSSDLQRAVTTAEALGGTFSAPLLTRPGLREISFGEWEGLCWKQIEERDATYARRWIEAYPNLPTPGGESFESFRARVLSEVTSLLNLPNPERIAVVTHAGVMRMVLRTLCGVEDEQEAWKRTSSYCCFFRQTREVNR